MVGSARDVVEECGVARFVFTDFPLGNPVGKPWDAAMQAATVELALDLAESAVAPRTTIQTQFRWSEEDGWRDRYMQIQDRAALAKKGEARRRRQAQEKVEGPIRG